MFFVLAMLSLISCVKDLGYSQKADNNGNNEQKAVRIELQDNKNDPNARKKVIQTVVPVNKINLNNNNNVQNKQ